MRIPDWGWAMLAVGAFVFLTRKPTAATSASPATGAAAMPFSPFNPGGTGLPDFGVINPNAGW
jgi:hypothetical protein